MTNQSEIDKRAEIKLKAYRLFCQHCQALQKVMRWNGKPCWVTQYNEPEAICASAIDAIDGLFNEMHSQGAVIQVKELPIVHWCELCEHVKIVGEGVSCNNLDCQMGAYKWKLKAGYVKSHPLIGEK